MPSVDAFESQSLDYQESVLPQSVKARVAVEAGSSAYWYRWVGLEGAVVGVDPFRTAGDLFLEKTKRLPPREMGPAAIMGTFLERGIIAWAADQLHVEVITDPDRLSFVHPEGIRSVNLDGLVLQGEPLALEAKAVGLMGRPAYYDQFGQEGTAELPEHILCQVHHQFGVIQAQPDLPPIRTIYVPALLAFRGFVMFRVECNDDLVAALAEAGERFWFDHVVADRMPTSPPPHLESLKRMRRIPEKIVDVDDALVVEWLTGKETKKIVDAKCEEAQRSLLAALGDAEGARCRFGDLTYFEQGKDGERMQKTSRYRVLRLKTFEGK